MTLMMMRNRITLAAMLLAFAFSLPVMAGVDEEIKKTVKKNLEMMIPQMESASIKAIPIPGLYEVIIGPDVFYVTQDGRYLIQGSIVDLESRENLTTPRRAMAASAAIEGVGEENMIIYEPKEVKHTVTIFTDIDCGYCRKLHAAMDGYLEYGIRIRYLFFPRAGVGSPSYKKAVAVWCADDRNNAMTQSKAGKSIELKECKNPVADHYNFGQLMNVQGTPAIFLTNGDRLPGYIPPDKLNAYLSDK
ncbi:Thiol:disulfide interchange protein DsbC [hydrothermal vent metagenome]|uniref:Thiol:disulfide interchange protein DsbC n=1 Tax=hydrothermal vent metagenome TaxID=652676 RepID=A0A3B1AM09_9ZZZZ